MGELRYDGKVAIVTGAGGGLGRSHALLLASRGAKVVVNDLGGSFKGEGSSQNAADKVVEEIKAAGGEAVANYDSVEFGDKIVQTAMDAYGKVDILINNAGILRDVSFQKMTQADWDLVYKVHVYGSYSVTQAVWPIMREQRFGRIIMTASAAGIYGNFGQANYSMAKLGLVGFSNTLALEGARRNIHVNTIAPIAGSRMTETVLPPDLLASLKPEYVSSLVAVLCHEDCEENGGLYEVGGGFYSKLRYERTKGKIFRLGREISVEDVHDNLDRITSFEETTHPTDVMSSMQPIMQNVEAGPSKGGNKYINVDEALGYEYPEVKSSYDERDLALYALGVGAAKDPANDQDLQLVYEMHSDGMKALPTYGVIPALNAVMNLAKEGVQAPGLNFGLDRILHGEQKTTLLRPLPSKATLYNKAKIIGIYDKGKHALVVTEVISTDEDGEELVRNEVTTLVRGAGGWGGDRGASGEVNAPPEREPDKVIEEQIPANQALLYRLSGDWNPLHADPSMAQAFGFDKPILHGLCTFGFAGRHVVQSFAKDQDPRYFKSIETRFADSVYPGETLITEMWKESDTKVIFQCKVKERDSQVITHSALTFYEEIPKPKAKAKKAAKAAAPAVSSEPISADIFQAMDEFIAANTDMVGKIKTVFQFKLSKPNSVWTIDLKDSGRVTPDASKKAACTLELSDSDFMDMCTGKADAMKLFSSGKLKISGDIMASQKLEFLQKIPPESVIAAAKRRTGSGGDAPAAEAESAAFTSWDVFIGIRDHIERNPGLVAKVGHVFLFEITDPASSWTIDIKNDKGGVHEGSVGKIDCTLRIKEEDFLSMTRGEADPMKLFTTGKLKISGNVMASQKLEFLQKIDPEEAKKAVAKARAAGQTASASVAEEAPKEAIAATVFANLEKKFAEKGSENKEATRILFKLSDTEQSWLVELGPEASSVKEGGADNVDVTLTLEDEVLEALVRGESTARQLYTRGRLRVDGDVHRAHQLDFLSGLL